MSNLTRMLKIAEKFLGDNSPVILTGIGVVGTVTTAVLTGKASFEAARILDDKRDIWRCLEEEPPLRTKAGLVWKLYIPPVLSTCVTVGAIIFANRISTRRAAALAAAYTVSEKAYSEYKDKIVEKIGEKKEQEARDEIAQDKVTRTPPSNDILITSGGQELFLESYTGRYFFSDMETLRKAENDINRNIRNNDYASLTDFYNLIGLQDTTISDEMGWNHDNHLELYFSATITDRGKPCVVMTYTFAPIREYHRLG